LTSEIAEIVGGLWFSTNERSPFSVPKVSWQARLGEPVEVVDSDMREELHDGKAP
jgi:hypothetical protein